MEERVLSTELVRTFAEYLVREERSSATCEKYLRDIRNFSTFACNRPITKELVMAWKKHLLGGGYAAKSVNSMLAAVNSLLSFLSWHECRVKNIRLQHQSYCNEDAELTKAEYMRLLNAAKIDRQLWLILQAICGTGIRVSELQFFTVEAVRRGEITVSCKNKTRTILIPGNLRKQLLHYAKEKKITGGAIFLSRNGRPLDRSVIWRKMKRLCGKAGVKECKVYPHNLRKLFACTFYSMERDIAKLADVLGHSSINTTRIYIMTTGREHRRKIERLGLVIPLKNEIVT